MKLNPRFAVQRSRTYSVPAPLGGWNTRDSLASMKPQYAVSLTNWWPTTVDLQIRRGFTSWATGMTGTVETLIPYNAPNGTRQLWAITSTGNLHNVTTQGVAPAATITGLSNGRWQHVSFASPAGNFILACNGTDAMLRYNGTTWIGMPSTTGKTISTLTGNGVTSTVTTATAHGLQTGNTITVTGASVAGFNVAGVTVTRISNTQFTYPSTGTPSATGASYTVAEGISGIDPTNISNINVFKTRIWLTQKNSLSQWYLASLAIQGAATEFPMGSIFPMGGFIQTMATWTVDAGQGSDDNAVFMSSEGEVAVYKGTDPASAATFALVGLYRQGNPIGNRCQIKFGGDILAITESGVVPMARSILTAQVTENSALTDIIQSAMAAAVTSNSGFGWDACVYPPENMLLINVPDAINGNYQFAMNTISGAFTKFTGFLASCWATSGANLYYGTAGQVNLVWTNDTDSGAPIVASALPAFVGFGSYSQTKKINMVRPIISTAGQPAVVIGINYDFDTTTMPSGVLNYSAPIGGMIWGSMTWGTMRWGSTLVLQKAWQMATGIGYTASMAIVATNNGAETRWSAVDYVFENGGIL